MSAAKLLFSLGLLLALGAVGWTVVRQTSKAMDYAALVCEFDVVSCMDPACTGPIASSFVLVPAGKGGAPELRMAHRPASLETLAGETPSYLSAPGGDMAIRFDLTGDEVLAWMFAEGAPENGIGMAHGRCMATNTGALGT